MIVSPPQAEFQENVDRLRKHLHGFHDAARAIGCAKEYGISFQLFFLSSILIITNWMYRSPPKARSQLGAISLLGAANMREVHQRKVQGRTPNTCEWIRQIPHSPNGSHLKSYLYQGRAAVGKASLHHLLLRCCRNKKNKQHSSTSLISRVASRPLMV